MYQAIVAIQPDGDAAWIATLACHHRRHLRHRPPMEVRPWLLDPRERARRLGAPLECLLCAAGSLPVDALEPAAASAWNGANPPEPLRHRTDTASWELIVVLEGTLWVELAKPHATASALELTAPSVRAIPPFVDVDLAVVSRRPASVVHLTWVPRRRSADAAER